MDKIGKFSLVHVILLVMTFIGLKNHVTILPSVLEHGKRDGWLSVIIASISTFVILLLMIYIQKKSNQKPIREWLKDRIGKVGSSIMLYAVVGYIYLLAAFTMHETILWISDTFLDATPPIVLLTVYIIVCFLLVSTNVQTIVMVNVVVLFAVVIFGFYVAIVNIQVKDYSLLQPFFQHGLQPILKATIYPASAYIEIVLLLFLQHHFKKPIKWFHIAIMIAILTGLTLGPLLGAISEFGPEEAAKHRYPAYEEWGLVSIGRYIEHMDFLSIYQWLTGTFIRVGLLLFIVADILKLVGNRKRIWTYMVPPFFIVSLVLMIIDDTIFLQLNNFDFLVITFIFFFALLLILTIIALFHKTKSNQSEQQSNPVNSSNNGTVNTTNISGNWVSLNSQNSSSSDSSLGKSTENSGSSSTGNGTENSSNSDNGNTNENSSSSSTTNGTVKSSNSGNGKSNENSANSNSSNTTENISNSSTGNTNENSSSSNSNSINITNISGNWVSHNDQNSSGAGNSVKNSNNSSQGNGTENSSNSASGQSSNRSAHSAFVTDSNKSSTSNEGNISDIVSNPNKSVNSGNDTNNSTNSGTSKKNRIKRKKTSQESSDNKWTQQDKQ
ncbi:MAG TPA: endospore germination permease [Ureibacillus sp.]|nr:endospore germination permease [Ureibacillus sp.]